MKGISSLRKEALIERMLEEDQKAEGAEKAAAGGKAGKTERKEPEEKNAAAALQPSEKSSERKDGAFLRGRKQARKTGEFSGKTGTPGAAGNGPGTIRAKKNTRPAKHRPGRIRKANRSRRRQRNSRRSKAAGKRAESLR